MVTGYVIISWPGTLKCGGCVNECAFYHVTESKNMSLQELSLFLLNSCRNREGSGWQ